MAKLTIVSWLLLPEGRRGSDRECNPQLAERDNERPDRESLRGQERTVVGPHVDVYISEAGDLVVQKVLWTGMLPTMTLGKHSVSEETLELHGST